MAVFGTGVNLGRETVALSSRSLRCGGAIMEVVFGVAKHSDKHGNGNINHLRIWQESIFIYQVTDSTGAS